MTTVKFDFTTKYNGVLHPAHEVFEVRDEDAEELRREGATIMSTTVKNDDNAETDVAPDTADTEDTQADTDPGIQEKLLEYTVAELVQFAENNDIDLRGKTRKADIYNVIIAALN